MTQAADALAGARIFIVEDETLVAMLLEDMLEDTGCELAASVCRVSQALDLISEGKTEFDAAILDVNVAGEQIFPVAEALAKQSKPFAFATGYGEGGLPETWRNRPTLQKPFNISDVQRVLGQMLS